CDSAVRSMPLSEDVSCVICSLVFVLMSRTRTTSTLFPYTTLFRSHVAIALGKGKDDAVFAGDLIHSPLQLAYPELSPKFDVDPAQAAVTRRTFLERYGDTATVCCTAHFPSPSAGRIKRKGNGFSCEAI